MALLNILYDNSSKIKSWKSTGMSKERIKNPHTSDTTFS